MNYINYLLKVAMLSPENVGAQAFRTLKRFAGLSASASRHLPEEVQAKLIEAHGNKLGRRLGTMLLKSPVRSDVFRAEEQQRGLGINPFLRVSPKEIMASNSLESIYKGVREAARGYKS